MGFWDIRNFLKKKKKNRGVISESKPMFGYRDVEEKKNKIYKKNYLCVKRVLFDYFFLLQHVGF